MIAVEVDQRGAADRDLGRGHRPPLQPLEDRFCGTDRVRVRQRDVRSEAVVVLGHPVRPPLVGDRGADRGAQCDDRLRRLHGQHQRLPIHPRGTERDRERG
jgi:hypothetical protein